MKLIIKNNNQNQSVSTKTSLSGFQLKKFSFTDKRKESFYRELGLLLQSGVDFKKSLEIVSNQALKKEEQEIIQNIKNKIVQGKAIWEALKESGYFTNYEYHSIQIGEETRRLEAVLIELQKYYAQKIQMKRQIVSVLTYPAIVLTVTLAVLYFMLNKVVPMFSSVFRQFGSELPKSTQIILKISNHSGAIFSVIFLLIVGSVLFHHNFKNNTIYRQKMAAFLLRIPYFGKLIQKIYIARFCQAMNLLTGSKTTLLQSLTLTSKMIGYFPIETSIENIKTDVTKGISLSDSMRKHTIYENKLISMIEVAEQINELDSMFERLTHQYNEEINHQTKMIGVVLEPLIIIFIGVIVGVIMISMYAPMFDLSKIIRA
jgi:type IV pilus assembly protein PilC